MTLADIANQYYEAFHNKFFCFFASGLSDTWML